jgi:hypothetical protein
MKPRTKQSVVSRLLLWGSWLSVVAGILVAAIGLFSHWGVNAATLGASDAGLALSLAFLGGAALIGAMYAAPLLAVVGLLVLFIERRSAIRFLIAAAILATPLATVAWLDRT